MFKRNIVTVPAIIAALSILIIGCALYLSPTVPSALEGEQSDSKAYCADYTSETKYGPGGSASTIISGKQKLCKEQGPPAYDSDESENTHPSLADADLLAQEKMAFWTQFMAIFSALGLGALVWTLYEQRRLVETQSRAYLEHISGTVSFSNSDIYQVRIIINNIGQTPAKKMELSGTLTFHPASDDQGNIIKPPITLHLSGGVKFLAPTATGFIVSMGTYSFGSYFEGLLNHQGRYIYTEETKSPHIEVDAVISFVDAFRQKRSIPVQMQQNFIVKRNERYMLYGGTGRKVENHTE